MDDHRCKGNAGAAVVVQRFDQGVAGHRGLDGCRNHRTPPAHHAPPRAHDPAYPHALCAVEHGPNARVLLAGPPPPGRTGKLNAMIVGLAAARGELVAFGDSDTHPDRDVLRLLVEALHDDGGAGVAFAPVVVHRPARTAGDVGYALLINAWYGASVAMMRKSGSLPFIMGQLMVWRRSALDAIGGLTVAEGQLVDDMYLGRRVSKAGLRNVMIF